MGRVRGPGAAHQHSSRRHRRERPAHGRRAPGDREVPLPPRLRQAAGAGRADRRRPLTRERSSPAVRRQPVRRERCAASSIRPPGASCCGTSRSGTAPAGSPSTSTTHRRAVSSRKPSPGSRNGSPRCGRRCADRWCTATSRSTTCSSTTRRSPESSTSATSRTRRSSSTSPRHSARSPRRCPGTLSSGRCGASSTATAR